MSGKLRLIGVGCINEDRISPTAGQERVYRLIISAGGVELLDGIQAANDRGIFPVAGFFENTFVLIAQFQRSGGVFIILFAIDLGGESKTLRFIGRP